MNRQTASPRSVARVFLTALCLAVLTLTFLCLNANAQTKEWVWMGGSNMFNQDATAATLGIPAPGNAPGGRFGAASWTDSTGNLWSFGGIGHGFPGISYGYFNDIWEYDPSTQQWAWMGGGTAAGQPGVYGTLGVAAAGNVPGARSAPANWTDSSGNLWLFGGYGYDSAGTQGYLNDLWKYTPSTNEWAWMGGSSTVPDFCAQQCGQGGQPGVYGTPGVPDATNIPGGRFWPSSWTDSSGNLWLFGGQGFDTTGDYEGYLNDLWEFNPSTQQWTWIGGSNSVLCPNCGHQGAYGTLGTAAATNIPGGRYGSVTWTDDNGNLWLFGGLGFDQNRILGYLNDMWQFNPSTQQWAWINGNSTVPNIVVHNVNGGQPGVHGAAGAFAPGNTPGGRYTPNSWTDGSGNLWLFGGAAYDSGGTFNELNDLWQFNPATQQWAWMGGVNTANSMNLVGVYGTEGTPAAGNIPGGRWAATSWSDFNGNLWLFSGSGYDAAGNFGDLSDLWEYPLSTTTLTAAPTFSAPPGIYGGELTVTLSDVTPGATIFYTTDGTTPTAASPIYSNAIILTANTTISAMAQAGGKFNKGVAIATYTILPLAAAPTFSVAPGNYLSPQSVTITDVTPGATVYYTTDGSTPTTSSTVYSGTIAVNSTETISAFAVAPGYFNSTISSAPYTIGLPPPGNWTWMGGSNTGFQAGITGTLGTPASGNIPGSRYSAAFSTDSNGNFWLFGGQGYDAQGNPGFLNDLWEFSASAQQWSWMSGDSTFSCGTGCGDTGSYGAQGVPDPANYPGGRWQPLTWNDASGNLWLFGGQGWDSAGTEGYLNDLWVFNVSAGQWIWISGSSTVPDNGNSSGGSAGVYGTLGTAATGNMPGGRYGTNGWIDGNGNFWLFGGYGYDSAGTMGFLNDLWQFNPGTGQWTWMSGSSTIFCGVCGQPGIYGALGTPAPGNMPGSRYGANTWIDGSGNLWLFGGNGIDIDNYNGDLNDLWEFNPSTGLWAWMGGPPNNGGSGVYGVAGIAAAANLPGARDTANNWLDKSGNLWLFGGEGYDSQGNFGNLNDLWEYSFSTGQWTWMGGLNYIGNNVGQPGVYGTLGTPAAGNLPGARFGASSWTDSSGNLWLFGGDGFDSNGSYGWLNDLWEYQFTAPVQTVIATPVISLASGVYLPGQSVTISDTTQGATIYYTTDGSVPTTASTVYAGTITVNATETISAIAGLSGAANSPMATATYTIEVPADAPMFSVPSGSYDYSPVVTLSDTTPGAAIFFTMDGSTPTAFSSRYVYPIAVNATETLSAIAVADGYFNSAISTVTYTITGNPPQAWAWMSGSSQVNAAGVYGTLGVFSNGTPGARYSAANWADQNGNLWLFGGYALDSAASGGYSNDLWQFNIASRAWTWMGGGTTDFAHGVYGVKGTPASTNIPGSRFAAGSTTDSNGNLWFFGGVGYGATSNDYGLFNDLWEFNSSTQQWTWISGSGSVPAGSGHPGVYGTMGTPAAANVPGSRDDPSAWIDKSGNFWLFGGSGYDSAGSTGYLNDLWKYNSATSQWTWISGSNSTIAGQGVTGVYGTQGVAAAGNVPGSRYSAVQWTSQDGNLWLFGGWGRDGYGNVGCLNDLWEFNVTTGQWAWMGGSSTLQYGGQGFNGVYGAEGVPGVANGPGARYGAVSWTDHSGNLWLFGGWGYDSISIDGYLNDLWEYNPSTAQWTWMSGANLVGYPAGGGHAGIYGTLGTAAAGNNPGGRQNALSWIDGTGNLWLFGGTGYDAGGSWGSLNDLWQAPISGNTGPTQTPTLTWVNPAAITYGTALSATQLNATANVLGNFLYTPPAGTILATGTQTLSVTFTPSDAADYTTAAKAVSLTLLPATPNVNLTCAEIAYDGIAHACTATASGLNGVAVSGSWILSPATAVNAGAYTVTASFTSSDPNYTGATASGTLTIDPINQSPTVSCPGPLTYDTGAHVCTITGGFGTCTSASATNVPGGTVALTCTGDANHNPWSSTGAITINPTASTTTVTCFEVTYTGAPQNCIASVTPAGTCTGLVAYTNAGSYLETAACTPDNTNYAPSSGSGTLKIDLANQNPVASCPSPVTYDGAAHSCTITGGFGTCTSASVTDVPGGSVALSCVGDANHNAWSSTGTITINAAPSTTTVSCTEVTYNGAPQNCIASVTPAGTCTGLVAYTNAASYPETATCTPTNTNYAPSSGGGILKIDAANQSPSVACPGPSTYDGAAHTCTITSGVGTCTSTSVNNVPGGSVALSCAGDSNHNPWSNTGTITITAAIPAISVTCPSVTFDGNAHSCTATATGIGGITVAGSFTFNPPSETAVGSYPTTAFFTSGNTNYADASGSGTLIITLTTPVLSISPSSPMALTFSSQFVGSTSAAQYITLKNTGKIAVSVGPALASGPFIISDYTGGCSAGMSLPAGAACMIRVNFVPATATPATGSVVISSPGAPGGSYTVSLSGTGQATVAAATLSTNAVTFANPQIINTTSPAQYVTLASTGSASLVVTQVLLGGANPQDFTVSNQAGACYPSGVTLAYNAKCNIRVVFNPTATGARTATLYIYDNAPDSPQQITLTGTATPAAQLSISNTLLTFSSTSVGSTTVAQYVTLKNTGTVSVSVASASLGGAEPGDFVLSDQAGTCTTGMTLTPGVGCNLRVYFAPKATGTRGAILTINDNTPAGPHTVSLTGIGQ